MQTFCIHFHLSAPQSNRLLFTGYFETLTPLFVLGESWDRLRLWNYRTQCKIFLIAAHPSSLIHQLLSEKIRLGINHTVHFRYGSTVIWPSNHLIKLYSTSCSVCLQSVWCGVSNRHNQPSFELCFQLRSNFLSISLKLYKSKIAYFSICICRLCIYSQTANCHIHA